MTLFEAINEFIKKMGSSLIVEEIVSNEYKTCLKNGNLKIEASAGNIVDSIIKTLGKAGIINKKITVTKTELAFLQDIDMLIDCYSPFIRFSISNYIPKNLNYYDYYRSNKHYVIFKFESSTGCSHGEVLANIEDTADIENAVRKSICKAKKELAVLDEQTYLSVIANYIKYENGRNPDNDAEFVIRKKDEKFSVLIRTNSISHAERGNLTPPVEAQSERLEEALSIAAKKSTTLTKCIGEYYLDRSDTLHSYILMKIDAVLSKINDENIILSICQNIDKEYSNDFYAVKFKDMSTNKIIEMSECDYLSCSLCIVLDNMAGLYHLSYEELFK